MLTLTICVLCESVQGIPSTDFLILVTFWFLRIPRVPSKHFSQHFIELLDELTISSLVRLKRG